MEILIDILKSIVFILGCFFILQIPAILCIIFYKEDPNEEKLW